MMLNNRNIDERQLATISKVMKADRSIIIQRIQDWFDLTYSQAVIVHKELQARLDQPDEINGWMA